MDSDSSDDDIFVVMQFKSVNKLTRRDILKLKEDPAKAVNIKKEKHNDSITVEKKRDSNKEVGECIEREKSKPKRGNKRSNLKSSGTSKNLSEKTPTRTRQITDYFSSSSSSCGKSLKETPRPKICVRKDLTPIFEKSTPPVEIIISDSEDSDSQISDKTQSKCADSNLIPLNPALNVQTPVPSTSTDIKKEQVTPDISSSSRKKLEKSSKTPSKRKKTGSKSEPAPKRKTPEAIEHPRRKSDVVEQEHEAQTPRKRKKDDQDVTKVEIVKLFERPDPNNEVEQEHEAQTPRKQKKDGQDVTKVEIVKLFEKPDPNNEVNMERNTVIKTPESRDKVHSLFKSPSKLLNLEASPIRNEQRSRSETLTSPGMKRPKGASLETSPVRSQQPSGFITLSPGVKRRMKRFNLPSVAKPENPASKSPKSKIASSPKTKAAAILKQIEAVANVENRPPFEVPPFDEELPLENNLQAFGSVDGDLLREIINQVIKQQIKLCEMRVKENQTSESLIDPDITILFRFVTMKVSSQMFYTRMLFRKKGWHRLRHSKMNYTDLDVNAEVGTLIELNFASSDIDQLPLAAKLNLLNVGEIRTLCKLFANNISRDMKKGDLISALLSDAKSQRSVMDMFKSSCRPTRTELMEAEIRKTLGPCFQLNELEADAMSRAILLFSLVHDVDEEINRASSQRLLMHNVLTNQIRFVEFEENPTVIFEKRDDFLEYWEALKLKSRMEQCVEKKDHEGFTEIVRTCRCPFMNFVRNEEYCSRVNKLPVYLRKYCAAGVYGFILTKYCEMFKMKTDPAEVRDILEDLLSQTIFNVSSRGSWYEQLAKLLPKDEAAQLMITASDDSFLNDVQHLTLKIRARKMLKAKGDRIQDENIRVRLNEFCTISVLEPASIEINAKAVEGNIQGSKLLYVVKTSSGYRFSSVEEQAIYFYKSNNGFTEGVHDEGFTVATIFYALFWDIIYSSDVGPGIFQSRYQTRPLDFYSKAFYQNRKELCDSRLAEMLSWKSEDVAYRIGKVFEDHVNKECVITWKEYLTPSLLCEIVECLGLRALQNICQRFITSPRIARSGFPDLLLWNKELKTCKIVEVKSPNDRLSPKQRLWLDYLKNAGVDCEVCNVKNTASKKKFGVAT